MRTPSTSPKIAPGARSKRKVGQSTSKTRKTPTIAKLKVKLEALQKQITLQKYGNDCYTCDAKDLVGKNCHLGHVPWPRPDISIPAKFDHRYTRAQCMVCNVHRGGMGGVAYARMQSEGIDMIMLREYADTDKRKAFSRSWFLDKIEEYKALLEE